MQISKQRDTYQISSLLMSQKPNFKSCGKKKKLSAMNLYAVRYQTLYCNSKNKSAKKTKNCRCLPSKTFTIRKKKIWQQSKAIDNHCYMIKEIMIWLTLKWTVQQLMKLFAWIIKQLQGNPKLGFQKRVN